MSIAFNKVRTALGMDDILPFGRHQGYTVGEILKDKPGYIAWLIRNTQLKFYQSVHDEINRITLKIDRIYKYKSYIYTGELRGDIASYEAELNAELQDWDEDVPF